MSFVKREGGSKGAKMTTSDKADIGYSPSLALFDKPSINTGIMSHKYVQFIPVSQFSKTGVLQFTIDGTSNYYVNLKCSYLQVKGKIVKENGDAIDEGDEAGFINLPLQTLWSQVDFSLQHKRFNANVGTNYAYKSYIDTLLKASSRETENQLTSQLFGKDTAGDMDKIAGNGGFIIRSDFTKNSQIVQMLGPLCLDICQQDRLLLNGVQMNLKFWPNKAPFYIMTDKKEKGYYFDITDAYLNVCMVEVSPGILVGHGAALKESPALYPYYQSDVQAVSISKGLQNFSIDNIFQGDIPSDLIVGLVSEAGYIGSYDKNPFNFQHFNCNYCGFTVDDISVPAQPFEPLFKDEKEETELTKKQNASYNEAYLSLFGRKYHSKETVPISREEYPFGYCLYKFQLSENDKEEEDYVSLPRRGQTRLHFRFSKPLPESVTAIIYAHFPKMMHIDESRNVFV